MVPVKKYRSIRYPTALAGWAAVLLFALACSEPDASPPLSPQQALASFVLADPALKIELVAAEPLVQDPVAITFDETGRLWVVEMLGFMQDIDGTGEEDPVGRVSILTDTDGDGQMDHSQLFLDSLVLPRAIAVVKGGALVAENIPLWLARDADGDGTAESRTLLDPAYGGSGMPEHSANGLWRGMDNWYYNAKSHFRYRLQGDAWLRDSTEFRGQWGISHDDAGRLFYNYNWSQLHADLVPPGSIGRNPHHTPTSGIDHGLTLERTIFPIRSNTAVNRGYVPGTLDEGGKLLEFASACGPLVYRGNALPEGYGGDAFVCEPTANLIKQNKVFEEGFLLRAEGAYRDREFLASTDERFRPVSLASGPDGALYVVDMYKGIIQHGPYMTPYLREVTLQRKLDKPIHMGRIWRITSAAGSGTQAQNLAEMDVREWIQQLGSPNGWTRDMAQRLLVESGDTAAVEALGQMATEGVYPAQLHALWALEGLGKLDRAVLWQAARARDPHVVQAALRLLSESPAADSSLRADLTRFIEDRFDSAHPLVQLQMVLSGYRLPDMAFFGVGKKFLEKYGALPLARDAVMSSLAHREYAFLNYLREQPGWAGTAQEREIFTELLAAAVVRRAEGAEVLSLFRMLEGELPAEEAWVQAPLAAGMLQATAASQAPWELEEQPAALKKDHAGQPALQALLAELERRFTWPGKPSPAPEPAPAAYALDPAQMTRGRQQYLNLCASCHGTGGEGMARFAPPLKGSQWVLGEDYKLAMILLHGMEGPVQVQGKIYDIPDILPSMPSFSTLQDADLAAMATYIRNAWGNRAPPVSGRQVGGIRFRTQGKIQPWKASQLDTLRFEVE